MIRWKRKVLKDLKHPPQIPSNESWRESFSFTKRVENYRVSLQKRTSRKESRRGLQDGVKNFRKGDTSFPGFLKCFIDYLANESSVRNVYSFCQFLQFFGFVRIYPE